MDYKIADPWFECQLLYSSGRRFAIVYFTYTVPYGYRKKTGSILSIFITL